VSFTLEITLWCEAEGCPEWVQYNYADARGHPRTARRLAADQSGWTWGREKGDRCREHS
jgi:hypothetical protein